MQSKSPCRSCSKLEDCNTSCDKFDKFYNVKAEDFISAGVSDTADDLGYNIKI